MTRRILLIKHGALGDIIQGLDAYASLRASFAGTHITMLTSAAFSSFMRAMPYFDEVIEDKRAPFWNVKSLFQIRAILRDDFDLVIDLQCSKRTNRYHQLLSAKGQRWYGTAIGCSHPYPDFTGVNNAKRMMIAAEMAGAIPAEADLSFLGAGRTEAIAEPYAVLMPGCSPAKPSKRWPASSFAALATLLADAAIRPVVVGTAVDLEACDDVCIGEPRALNLCGQTNLAELAALAARSKVNIGNDSGPIFLAAKTGALSVMLMGADTDPSMSAPTGKRADYIKVETLSDLSAADVMRHISAKLSK